MGLERREEKGKKGPSPAGDFIFLLYFLLFECILFYMNDKLNVWSSTFLTLVLSWDAGEPNP